ncbi:phosphate-starvation-inducible PsiE family protein [Zhongshania sp.]|jgi:protein PsiE|uniref:phosphate-starvation-inducible PsiE family protein n=1 Tax=Zhongshania sp. TaxID=1971902 RepID=UPI0039E5BE24
MNSEKNSKENTNEMKRSDGLDAGNAERSLVLAIFHLIQRIILIIVVVMTLGAVAFEINTIYIAQTISLADILLMFLYLEVVGMVAVFYSDQRSAFVYPIFIAITALARLIVLQGKDMAPENILFEAIAILLLAIAAVILIKMRND